MQDLIEGLPTSQRQKYTRRINQIKSERDTVSRAMVYPTLSPLTPDFRIETS
jgi:hypothetical protein